MATVRTLLALAAALILATGAGADETADAARHLDALAPTIAVVKCVLHVQWSSGESSKDSEQDMDVRGAVVDPTGIVLTRASSLGGETPELKAWLRENSGAQYKSVPENLRVVLPPDAAERPAVVLAMDGRHDLAFLQVLDLGETRLPAVDLGAGTSPRLGQTLFGVSRDGEGYGHAPGIWTVYPAGRLEKPMAMWLAGGDFNVVGLPVFALDGKPCGVLSEQSAVEGAAETGEQDKRLVILPLDPVVKSLEAARRRLPEVLEAVRKQKEEKEKEKEKAAPAVPAPEPKTPETPK
jgi:hypothetical protein